MKETLQQHREKIAQLRSNLEKAAEELQAYEKAFNVWLQESLGLADNKKAVHLVEILAKWDEKTK